MKGARDYPQLRAGMAARFLSLAPFEPRPLASNYGLMVFLHRRGL